MYDDDLNASPVNPLPWVVVVLVMAIVGIEVVFQLAGAGLIGAPTGVGWRLESIQRFGVSSNVFDWMWINKTYPLDQVIRLFTFPFVHVNATHTLFVAVFVLAMGKYVGDVMHPLAVLAIFVVSGALGALFYIAVIGKGILLVGGYANAYGLIGGFSFLLFSHLRATGGRAIQAFTMIGFLLALQIFWQVVFDGSNDWIAQTAGFVVGFVMSIFLAPDGMTRLRALLSSARRE